MLDRVKGLVAGLASRPTQVETETPTEAFYRRVHVIINPAAGQDYPVLGALNSVFHPAAVDWDVFITKRPGDARRLAAEAVAAGADAVAVYGGDGTVAEVASGLMGSQTPLAILPGGTANVASVELGIPGDLAAAARLLCTPHQTRPIDMGEVNGHPFILRVGLGLEAQMVEGADRALKNRMGTLAYALSALQALREPQPARYHLTIDGQTIESDGVLCIIANMGSMGWGGATLASAIDVSDGLLDVLVVRQTDLRFLLSVTAAAVAGGAPADAVSQPTPSGAEALQSWQGREILVTPDPLQSLQVDGEVLEAAPVHARVFPGAVRVIVPPESQIG